MPWVKFTADFDWHLKPSHVTAYKAGMRQLVTTPCAAEAIKLGKAVKLEASKRPSARGKADGRR